MSDTKHEAQEVIDQLKAENERLASELRIAKIHLSAKQWELVYAERAASPFHGMYQDADGTIPVTVAGQPVGLVVNRLPPFIKDDALRKQLDEARARAIKIIGWHRNEYNGAQIDHIIQAFNDAWPEANK